MRHVVTKATVTPQADGSVKAVFSTDAVDRMGDVIVQTGWELENYQRNPVVLWGHDCSIPPVGRTVQLGVERRGLVGTIEFAPSEHGRSLEKLYKGGFLSSFSVGFKPLEAEPRGGGKGFRYLRSELLEVSCVSVPANQDATLISRSGPAFTEKFANITRLLLGEPRIEAAPSWDLVRRGQEIATKAMAGIEAVSPWERLRRLKVSMAATDEAMQALRDAYAWSRHEHAVKSLSAVVEIAKGWRADEDLGA